MLSTGQGTLDIGRTVMSPGTILGGFTTQGTSEDRVDPELCSESAIFTLEASASIKSKASETC